MESAPCADKRGAEAATPITSDNATLAAEPILTELSEPWVYSARLVKAHRVLNAIATGRKTNFNQTKLLSKIAATFVALAPATLWR